MLFDQSHEVGRSVARKRRLGEMRIRGKKILRAGVQIGEIAAAAAGDQDLLPDSIRAFEHQHTASALAGFDGTHQPGSTASENDDVIVLINTLINVLIHAEISLTKRRTAVRFDMLIKIFVRNRLPLHTD